MYTQCMFSIPNTTQKGSNNRMILCIRIMHVKGLETSALYMQQHALLFCNAVGVPF